MNTQRLLFLLSPLIFGVVCLLVGYTVRTLKKAGKQAQEDAEESAEKHTSRILRLVEKDRLDGRILD